MQMTGYFDNAATTIPSQAALHTYEEVALAYPANPSSSHREGKRAARLLQDLREQTAALLKTNAEHITFTAGATEANDIVLSSLLWRRRAEQVVFSGIEHSSILEWSRLLTHTGWTVTSVDAPGGLVETAAIEAALHERTRLVSVLLVNNTLGTIQDVGAIAQAVRLYEREHNSQAIHLHCDATQALGKIAFNLTELGVDSASFSAHKFHGPRGVGILYNTRTNLEALSRAGGQEQGLRGGTENVPAIAAMVCALTEATERLDQHLAHVKSLNSVLRMRLKEVEILTPHEHSSPYILTISIPPLPSEVAERMLSDAGFCVSAGSACAHNARQKGAAGHHAMRLDKRLAESSIRISFSHHTTLHECEALADAILAIHRKHR